MSEGQEKPIAAGAQTSPPIESSEAQPNPRKTRALSVLKRVLIGTYQDGFVHAGNLAYMTMLAIFPLFIFGAALFSFIGEDGEKAAMLDAVLKTLPSVVSEVIEPVARNIIDARSGWLLWAGGLVGIWTVSSLLETIRDVLRHAYGEKQAAPFWKNRLLSAGVLFLAVILLMVSLVAQFMIGAAQEFIHAYWPELTGAITQLGQGRIVTSVGLFASIYLLFSTLSPKPYRKREYPKWPGALLVTLWWMGVSLLLPPLLRSFFNYDLTYGSMAGIMTTLLFFYLVGLGIVVGAELNAALAVPEKKAE